MREDKKPGSSSNQSSRASTGAGLKPSDVLARAADLIEPEGAWTSGVFARNEHYSPVTPDSPNAVCWCARGAVAKVMNDGPNSAAVLTVTRIVTRQLFGERDEGRLAQFNDASEREQTEVVKALRDAAELARSEGQ